VTSLGEWLDRHAGAAPAELRARVREYALDAPSGAPPPAALAAAAHRALAYAVAHPGDRSAALDLLAADALVTLALLAQAEQAPAELEPFASAILQAVRPGA
jgi:hypothetical protein